MYSLHHNVLIVQIFFMKHNHAFLSLHILSHSDVGFERTDYNSLCTPVDGYYPFTPGPTDCTVSNYYNSSNGYVLLL